MASSKAKTLASLFKNAAEKAVKDPSSSLRTREKALKQLVSWLGTPPSHSSIKRSPKPTKKPASDGIFQSRLLQAASASADAPEGSRDSEEMMNGGSSLGSNFSNNDISLKQKEISGERRQKWVYKETQGGPLDRLIKMCGDKLGTKVIMEVFDKLGRDMDLKECNALLEVCLEKARTSNDEDDAFKHMSEAFRIFKKMWERGFEVDEGTYGPFLMYFIDMGMVEMFFFFCGHIKEGNPSCVARLGYYEMLLWIRVNNEEKIQEICNCIVAGVKKMILN
ncbi:pentatricopeptide repeat-containing protein At4g04790, mitochondrial-like [Hibiscus syriacus]|uniref:pentatricopeptide repeat-containing protein At4g04790, mitochondrial-like n=1 Tax=Hibiscus syriacus TaxID=106335 RepID=UPI001921E21E|nr:pentatricopeptide repeat-containing protein At4g04790, mitochondrial-like [Hibiscus syriacus]